MKGAQSSGCCQACILACCAFWFLRRCWMTRFAVRTSTTFVNFASQAHWSPLDLAVCHSQVEGSEWTVTCAIAKVHCGLRQVQHLGDGRLAAVFWNVAKQNRTSLRACGTQTWCRFFFFWSSARDNDPFPSRHCTTISNQVKRWPHDETNFTTPLQLLFLSGLQSASWCSVLALVLYLFHVALYFLRLFLLLVRLYVMMCVRESV